MLAKLKKRQTLLGYGPIQIFYTDNCCHEYNTLVKAFLELRDERTKLKICEAASRSSLYESAPDQNQKDQKILTADDSTLPALELPASPSVITSYPQLQLWCNTLASRIGIEVVHIGFDLEWDSTGALDRRVRILQLGHHSLICVVQLDHCFGAIKDEAMADSKNCLKSLFQHEKVHLCGVAVSSDLTRLFKLPFAETLFGPRNKIKLYSLEYEYKRASLASTCPSLQKLRNLFLKKSLLKDDTIRRSKWSTPKLNEQQITYAALDAYASFILASKVKDYCNQFKRPNDGILEKGQPIRLTAANSDDVIAFGTVEGEHEAKNRNRTKSKQRKIIALYTVKVIHVRIPGALTMNATLMGSCAGRTIPWSRDRIVLSTVDKLCKYVPAYTNSKCIVDRSGPADATETDIIDGKTTTNLDIEAPSMASGKGCGFDISEKEESVTTNYFHIDATITDDGKACSKNFVRKEKIMKTDDLRIKSLTKASGYIEAQSNTSGHIGTQRNDSKEPSGASKCCENMKHSILMKQVEGIENHLPDGTLLSDYPEDHAIEISDDSDDDEKLVEIPAPASCPIESDLWKLNRIKLDPFHAINRIKRTLKKSHGMYETFLGLFRGAIFIPSHDDLEREMENLSSILHDDKTCKWYQDKKAAKDEAYRRLSGVIPISANILKNERRICPDPTTMEDNLRSIVNICANVPDAKTGDFFSQKTWKEYESLVGHVRCGCLSDPLDVNLYYTDENSSTHCVRGTSQLECFHAHVRRIFQGITVMFSPL